MYFLGHIGLGYIFAFVARKFSGKDFSIPIVFLCSLLPDLDLLIPSLPHRGPSHSIVIPLVLLLPFWLWFRNGLPYLASLLSHSLIGDLFTGYKGKASGMYLWPLSERWVNLGFFIEIRSKGETLIELVLFGLMVLLIVRTSIK